MDTKREMVRNLTKAPPNKNRDYRYVLPKNVPLQTLKTVSLPYFVNNRTSEFFEILGINPEFLSQDPSTWSELQSFQVCSFV